MKRHALKRIAHAREQYETGVLIRPRARYIGQRHRPALAE